MTLGVVLHAKSLAVFQEAARTLTGVTLKWADYRHDREIAKVAEQLLASNGIDGLLLGLLPYDACRHLLSDELPVTVVKPAALSLALAFAQARSAGHRTGRVSIDTFATETVSEVTSTLGLRPAQVTSLPYRSGQPATDIVRGHLRALDRGGFVISARTEVAVQLRGVLPVVASRTVPSTIRAEMHGLALRVQSRRADEFRFAAGVFLVAERSRADDVDRARIGLMNLLMNTPEFADAWIENRGRRGLVVFAHRALFEHLTHNWLIVPTLSQARDKLGINAAAGFGIGGSARLCVALAERAAARAESEGSPCGYLIQDSGVIIGPMSQDGRPVEFTYRNHGTHLEHLAGRVGLSPATLSRVVAIERGLRGRAISPSDLANALGITDPSGRRLVRKLLECGLVIADGTAQTHRKGRPTTLYRICIDQAIAEERSG